MTLEHALAQVPGYAAWRRLDPGPATPVDERYAALPVLTKQALREHFPNGFVPSDRHLEDAIARGDVEFAQTSGSTDDQVTLVFDAAWWEASERAAWQLHFMECEAGRLHQNIEHSRVDFQPWRGEYGGPALGRMLVTVLQNPWFAVLRFDVEVVPALVPEASGKFRFARTLFPVDRARLWATPS